MVCDFHEIKTNIPGNFDGDRCDQGSHTPFYDLVPMTSLSVCVSTTRHSFVFKSFVGFVDDAEKQRTPRDRHAPSWPTK